MSAPLHDDDPVPESDFRFDLPTVLALLFIAWLLVPDSLKFHPIVCAQNIAQVFAPYVPDPSTVKARLAHPGVRI